MLGDGAAHGVRYVRLGILLALGAIALSVLLGLAVFVWGHLTGRAV